MKQTQSVSSWFIEDLIPATQFTLMDFHFIGCPYKWDDNHIWLFTTFSISSQIKQVQQIEYILKLKKQKMIALQESN